MTRGASQDELRQVIATISAGLVEEITRQVLAKVDERLASYRPVLSRAIGALPPGNGGTGGSGGAMTAAQIEDLVASMIAVTSPLTRSYNATTHVLTLGDTGGDGGASGPQIVFDSAGNVVYDSAGNIVTSGV